MPSEAQKQARQKWDRAHMQVLTCKVTKEKADLFKKACTSLGVTMNSVFTKAIEEAIQKANL